MMDLEFSLFMQFAEESGEIRSENNHVIESLKNVLYH